MTTEIVKVEPKNAAWLVAQRLNVSPEELKKILKATAFKADREVTDEEYTALIVVAETYKLNPITKELYAFPNRGAIVPIVSVDGWVRLVTSHPDYDGVELIDNLDAHGNLLSVTAKFYRKAISHPVTITEYMVECVRPTDTWKRWPRRMLRHKAYIQGARMAFGFSGIYDDDEAERIVESTRPEKPLVAMPVRKTASTTVTVVEMEKATPKDPLEALTEEVVAVPVEQPKPAPSEVAQNASRILGAVPVEERPIPKGYKAMKAKCDTLCRGCKLVIKHGDDVFYSKVKGLFHLDCAE